MLQVLHSYQLIGFEQRENTDASRRHSPAILPPPSARQTTSYGSRAYMARRIVLLGLSLHSYLTEEAHQDRATTRNGYPSHISSHLTVPIFRTQPYPFPSVLQLVPALTEL